MAGTAIAPEFGTWSAPGHSLKIEYASAVLDQIRMAAVEGYHRVPHGGVETGGILFGTHEPDLVRIQAWRPITCQYAKGPSFVLSGNDEAVLAAMLESSQADPELRGLVAVGWYHSHTRSEIFLSDLDLALFDRYFPQPWQLALVVRPAAFSPVRAGFFFREADGSVHAQGTYDEFRLVPLRGAPAMPLEPSDPISGELPRPVVNSAPEPVVAAERKMEPFVRPRASRWPWYAGAILFILAAATGIRQYSLSRQHLSLSANETSGQLHISWDRSSYPVRNAVRGSLAIEDHGLRTEVNLTPSDLQSGSVSYAKQSNDVVIRLRVEQPDGPAVEEVTRFLKPGEPAARPTTSLVPDTRKQSLDREASAVQARIERQKVELSKLEQTVGSSKQQPGSAARVVPARPLVIPQRKTETQPAPVIAAPPPQIHTAPQTNGSAPLPGPAVEPAALPAAPSPAAALPAAAPPPHPKVTAPPASGRILWTGKLIKNGRLAIEGNHASAGALIGALPAAAARVVAYPGDLTAEGMTLFTPDARFTKPATEAAGAQNGWNRTTYTFDRKRAAGIRVVEQPSAQNGYKLVLQGETSKLSVLMLEWRAAQ